MGDGSPLPAGVSLFFSVGPAALGGAMAVVARRLLPHFEKRKPPERSLGADGSFLCRPVLHHLPNRAFMEAFFAYFLSRKKVG